MPLLSFMQNPPFHIQSQKREELHQFFKYEKVATIKTPLLFCNTIILIFENLSSQLQAMFPNFRVMCLN